MAWILTVGLTAFRAELDEVFPGRDKTTDGSVGDLAHQGGGSGHNPDRTGNAEYRDGDSRDEVRAVDVDRDLVPGSKVDWMLLVIQFLIAGMRAGRWPVVPFRYIIYRPAGSKVTYIWHVNTGWASRVYTGSNIHDKHAHFSGGWSADADSRTGKLGIAEVRGGSEKGEDMIVRKGDSGEEVKFWQYVLTELGYDIGTIDGDYGPKMEAAVNAYRKQWTPGSGPATLITGWNAFHALRALAAKYAGRPGAAGAPGAPGRNGVDGKDGRDGVFAGTLQITGGTLNAVAPKQGQGS